MATYTIMNYDFFMLWFTVKINFNLLLQLFHLFQRKNNFEGPSSTSQEERYSSVYDLAYSCDLAIS